MAFEFFGNPSGTPREFIPERLKNSKTNTIKNDVDLTLKDPGEGGRILPGGQEIACHFSQDHTMVTKFLDFIHKQVVKSFFYYLDRFPRNSVETEPRL